MKRTEALQRSVNARALECGDSSPLSAGDLSPSNVVGRTILDRAASSGDCPRRSARRCLADKSAKRKKRRQVTALQSAADSVALLRMNRFQQLIRFASAAWSWLAALGWVWRWLAKAILLGLVLLFALYPHPVLLVVHIRHLCDIESLIQPDLPEMAGINRELDAKLPVGATRKEEFKAVERYVYDHIRYEYDWVNWGNVDYWPTTQEVLARKREDCDGQAVLAASILRARGFKTATVVANLQHVWVMVDNVGLMGPQPDKNFRRVGGKVVLTLPQWRTLLAGGSMICKFPSVRSLLILFAALALAYHPCRDPTGLLGLSVVALVGFVVLLDWANHFEPRSGQLGLGMLGGAVGLFTCAWAGALFAARLQNRFVVKRQDG